MYMCFEDKKLFFTDNHGQWHFRSYICTLCCT